jgi:hypothetical protein
MIWGSIVAFLFFAMFGLEGIKVFVKVVLFGFAVLLFSLAL